jgi:hypothetical protein
MQFFVPLSTLPEQHDDLTTTLPRGVGSTSAAVPFARQLVHCAPAFTEQ